ncbi:MAG: hypothetical protein ACLUPK_06705 [Veillonella sp.]
MKYFSKHDHSPILLVPALTLTLAADLRSGLPMLVFKEATADAKIAAFSKSECVHKL